MFRWRSSTSEFVFENHSQFPVPLIFVLFRDGEAVSCLRQVTKPVRVKRRWTHNRGEASRCVRTSTIQSRLSRFVTAAVFVVARSAILTLA